MHSYTSTAGNEARYLAWPASQWHDCEATVRSADAVISLFGVKLKNLAADKVGPPFFPSRSLGLALTSLSLQQRARSKLGRACQPPLRLPLTKC